MGLSLLQYLLGIGSGALVGFSLGLVGGGGSILAVPLMVYLVGVPDPHLAIGSSAIAVAANAASGLTHHARQGNVLWRFAALFALAGVLGAALGSTLGKQVDGQRLLLLFALLMFVVAGFILRQRRQTSPHPPQWDRATLLKLLSFGLLTGMLSGFFGIGGGFLIVPGLMLATGMGIFQAIGSSLLAVTAFGLTTAGNYAWSGWVDWPLAAAFVVGGIGGSLFGTRLAQRLSTRRGSLNIVFALVIVIVASYMLWRSSRALGWI